MKPHHTLEKFGFKYGESGAHAARTIMLADLETLFTIAPPDAPRELYHCLINERNVLHKATSRSRGLAFRHLADLYALDIQLPLFRVFRELWQYDMRARPVLALQFALTRDALLRRTADLILETPLGDIVDREKVATLLSQPDPDRFSAASIRSISQNINSSWTQAGYLTGRVRKVRTRPTVCPENVAFALFLAWLEGTTGRRLLLSQWCGMLALPEEELVASATVASQRGIIDFRHSGGVVDIRFPNFLTKQEERWLHE